MGEARTTVPVLIVGSGPAGAATALFLERINPSLARQTVLLERHRHPREKICAGGLVHRVDELLESLGLRVEVPHVVTRTLRLRFGEGSVDLPDRKTSKVVRRAEFDALLAREAARRGAILHEGESVEGLRRDGDGIEVVTPRGRYWTRALVGADGAASLVRRRMGFARGTIIHTFVTEFPREGPPPAEMEFDFTPLARGIQGYVWRFPCLIDGCPSTSLGIFARGESPGSLVHRYLASERAPSGRGEPLKGFPERGYDPHETFARPNVLLAGDAAGTDPLLGEGISQAIEYGAHAAAAVARAVASGDYSFSGYTRRIVWSRMGIELRAQRKFARWLYGPNYRTWLSMFWNDRWLHRFLERRFQGYGAFTRHLPTLALVALKHRLMGDTTLPPVPRRPFEQEVLWN